MVDPNKKPREKSLNLQAWERLLEHAVGDLRVEWVPRKGKGKFKGAPVQACWLTDFVPDTFHADSKGRWEMDLELISTEGSVQATAKLQPKAAAAATLIPEPPLLRHRGALKPLPVARTFVWAVALGVLPQDLQWRLKNQTTDEEFVLRYFRSHRGEEVVYPGDLLDAHLSWEEEVAERERKRKEEEEARAAAEKAAAEKAAAEKAAAVSAAMVLLSERGVTDHTTIPETKAEWRLQEKARAILDKDSSDDSVLAAAALFQD